MAEVEWQRRFNELAAKYKASQIDLKRYTRVAQEHASKNQQLQEAYLKLKTELERQQKVLADFRRLEKDKENDKKIHDEQYRSLAAEFQKKRREEQEEFTDQTEKLRDITEAEIKRSCELQEQLQKLTGSWNEERAHLEEVRIKEARAYEMKLAEVENEKKQVITILHEEKQHISKQLEEWKSKNKKLQQLVKMNEQDTKLQMCEKEIEELLVNKKQLIADIDIVCGERDKAVAELHSERLHFLSEKKSFQGKIQIAEAEAKSVRHAYEQIHKENMRLQKENVKLGNQAVELEREINEKHKELLDTNSETRAIEEVSGKRVKELELLAKQSAEKFSVEAQARERKIDQLTKQYESIKAEMNYNKRNHVEVLKRVEEKNLAEKSRLKRELEVVTQKADDVKEKGAQRIADLEDKLATARQIQDDKLNDLQQAKAMISKLTDQLERIKSASEQTHKDFQLQMRESRETQTELEVLQAMHRDLKEKENKVSSKLQSMNSQNSLLRKEVQRARAENNELRKSILVRAAKVKKTEKEYEARIKSAKQERKAEVGEHNKTVEKLTKDKKKLKKIVLVLREHIKDQAVRTEQMERASETVLDTKTMEMEMLKTQLRDAERERDDIKRRRIAEISSD